MTRKDFIAEVIANVRETARKESWRPSELAAQLAFDTPKRAARLWRRHRATYSQLTVDEMRAIMRGESEKLS